MGLLNPLVSYAPVCSFFPPGMYCRANFLTHMCSHQDINVPSIQLYQLDLLHTVHAPGPLSRPP